MCIGGGGGSNNTTAPPPPPPAPTPVTVSRLETKARPKDREGRKRRRGSARQGMVIRRTSGVSTQSSGTGVNY